MSNLRENSNIWKYLKYLNVHGSTGYRSWGQNNLACLAELPWRRALAPEGNYLDLCVREREVDLFPFWHRPWSLRQEVVKERKELEEPLAYQELIFPVAIAQSVRSLRKTSETSWYLRIKNLRSAREWRLLWLQHHWLRLHHWRILSFNPLSMKLHRPEHPELGEMLFDVICPRNFLKTKVILSLTYLVVLPLCYL